MAAKQIQLTKLCMNRFHFEWALPTYVSSDGFLGSTVPCFQSASSIFRYRKCPSVHRVYSGVSRGPPSSKRWLLLLYLGLSFIGGLILLALGLLAFKYAERRARRLGVLDRKVV